MSTRIIKRQGKRAVLVACFSRKEFIEYLEERLIPDLKESGRVETARDFEKAIELIQHPNQKEVTYE